LRAADPSLQIVTHSYSHPNIQSLQDPDSPEDQLPGSLSQQPDDNNQSETSAPQTSQSRASSELHDQFDIKKNTLSVKPKIFRKTAQLITPVDVSPAPPQAMGRSMDEFPTSMVCSGSGFIDDEPLVKNEFTVKSNFSECKTLRDQHSVDEPLRVSAARSFSLASKRSLSVNSQSSKSAIHCASTITVVQEGEAASAVAGASFAGGSVGAASFVSRYDLEDLDATHRGCHKFLPRHPEEMFIEIGDPVYVEVEADDLWCEGVNLRTGMKGIFPSVYATDLTMLDEDGDNNRRMKFRLHFLGSVEVGYSKGTEVICQAINKVASARKTSTSKKPPPLVLIQINEYGIQMTHKGKDDKFEEKPVTTDAKTALKSRLQKMLSKYNVSLNGKKKDGIDHFFAMKNISFCGYHPKNERYFAFITKHPLEMRFACHVFLAVKSTRSIAEAVGIAFQKFYQQYMAMCHPTEDIYIE
jgi:hypothetical protein